MFSLREDKLNLISNSISISKPHIESTSNRNMRIIVGDLGAKTRSAASRLPNPTPDVIFFRRGR